MDVYGRSGALTVLPRGRNAAGREVVRASQRRRLLEAMADVVAEKGYARIAVADVILRAGVSRKTFYDLFASKEACFLAAYDAGVDALLAAIDNAIATAAHDGLAAVRAGVAAYLDMLAGSPAFARAFHIEVLGAGEAALARRAVVQQRFVGQLKAVHANLRAAHPEIPDVPAHIFPAAVGAVTELVTGRLVEGRADSLPELADAIVDTELVLLIGRELAGRLGPI